jgi:hypothetical protein
MDRIYPRKGAAAAAPEAVWSEFTFLPLLLRPNARETIK